MTNSFIETQVSHTGPYTSSLWTLLANAIRRLVARIRHQRQVRRDMERLMEMDDHALADIGLSRGDIVAHGRLPENDRVRQ